MLRTSQEDGAGVYFYLCLSCDNPGALFIQAMVTIRYDHSNMLFAIYIFLNVIIVLTVFYFRLPC